MLTAEQIENWDQPEIDTTSEARRWGNPMMNAALFWYFVPLHAFNAWHRRG